ncbi:MAG: threonine--tRNA ligase [Acholeplasmatales bacterium]|jgi:threonyl-tRNA synthetase|nr:threonine--tRNA ligase [Acholeplasmatales bacterium]MDD7395389.1 threonine--tRNA ligase [Acholeplasmatales bacterium]
MIKITFPDLSVKEFENGVTANQIATSISPSLAKKCFIAKLNDELIDLNSPILHNGKIELITGGTSGYESVLNHSCAHLLAQAIRELYPNAMFGVGPAIEEGFYYDIDLGDVKITEEDLPKIEKKMQALVAAAEPIVRKEVSKAEALEMFKNDVYKEELINELEDGVVISVYQQGNFCDLCRGPHVANTKWLKNFKLLSVSGAYWRGDAKKAQLQRIYGTCFMNEEELKQHLVDLEERKKRDHRKLGKELELFMFSEYGPGLAFWLPNGYTLRRTLEDFWIKLHKERGYMVINTPIMLNRQLWETSGHWDHYKDDMFTVEVEDGTYAIKPMNCPGAILVYNNSLHSYKELPLRYAELGNVHRYEASGALNGLFRVRGFTQDDAHTMITEDQIGEEVANIISLYDYVYSVFGLNYSIELSTRPEDNYIGSIEVWDKAEEDLKKACLATGHDFKINPGDGAFYGPKLDFKLRDSMNRIWQCGTVQLDMQLPGRFNCKYIAEDGSKKTPVMIHRACFGSIERFIGIITEHFAGAFPLWLAPKQVTIIPVNNDAHLAYARGIEEILTNAGIRVSIDDREEKLNYKIRETQVKKIPYTLVLGDQEKANNSVTYRHHGSNQSFNMPIDDFVNMLKDEIATLARK